MFIHFFQAHSSQMVYQFSVPESDRLRHNPFDFCQEAFILSVYADMGIINADHFSDNSANKGKNPRIKGVGCQRRLDTGKHEGTGGSSIIGINFGLILGQYKCTCTCTRICKVRHISTTEMNSQLFLMNSSLIKPHICIIRNYGVPKS